MKTDVLVEQLADELRRYCDKIDLTDPFDKTTRECWELVEQATRSGVNAELVWGVVRHYAEAYHQDKGDQQASSAAAIVCQLVEALEPYAALLPHVGRVVSNENDDTRIWQTNEVALTCGQVRRADTAVTAARAWLEEEAR